MYLRIARAAGLALVLSSLVSTTAFAALSTAEQKRINDAAGVVTAIRNADNGIPEDLWQKAACVIVIPDMKKAAFIIGGEYGKGVMSCRTAEGWSSPVFMELEKGSWGFQAGAQEIDLVLLVTDKDAAAKMLNNKVSLGADASVAAGPVGRAASASTTGTLATVLSYSRSKGLFAGINLSGGALKADKDSNMDAYSNPVPADVLNGNGATLAGATAFVNTLGTSARATSGTVTPPATDAK
ncbi:MAG TPA: lipid-binding SYLF domain-containing protein [Vicinamibacterales bacterium]|jgi:lipid-binding SYLF domain-containing protein|nr:lipid-binding SYLF domain-containing protein [Vicinamibacterales bacterium]